MTDPSFHQPPTGKPVSAEVSALRKSLKQREQAAQARRESLRVQLDELTDRELTAYWNIQQFPGLKVTGDEGLLLALKLLIVDGLLTERGIPHEYGKLTNRVQA